jgi:ATP-binding cassette subfamily B protein
MDGFRVLGVGIKREPWIFAVSTLGSVLFGALTVADAWVLGWSTDHVVLPAFRTGATSGGLVLTVIALFVGVAILRAVGIVARRLGAGVMQYRLQALRSTCGCRWRGTRSTPPASSCPTRTPT